MGSREENLERAREAARQMDRETIFPTPTPPPPPPSEDDRE